MKLLMLSNYFTPDLSAGSFRMQSLVDALEPWGGNGLEVDLITTRPNRYASLRTDASPFEDRDWLRVHRIELPPHKNGMADQARAYIRYAVGVRKLTVAGNWDAVFATSSRLMTAGLGAMIARRLQIPLYLDIRDLFTDNMKELLAGSPLKLLLPAFRMIERQSFRRAARINVVSQGFADHVRAVAPSAELRIMTNGIDDLFLNPNFRKPDGNDKLPLVVYAGNMGEGQGLHRIIPPVASALLDKVSFRLIGDGGRRKSLEAAVADLSLNNVELLPPVPRASLLEHYREADILFMHLNDLEAFRKVLPSKVFEYAATDKPILAGVSGYAAEFLSDHLPDAEVFEPLDAHRMTQAIERLIEAPPEPDRSDFRKAFARSNIMERLSRDILDMIDQPPGFCELAR